MWIYCIFDVIAADEVLVRNLPEAVWLMIVLFFSTIGSIAWLALGRPRYAGWRPGDTGTSAPRRRPGESKTVRISLRRSRPSDDERLRAWEADLQRREQDLRRRKPEEDPPTT